MSDPRPALLVVYPFCLDHVGHGNIQRLLGIARDLAANGFDVDVAYQGSARVAPVEGQYTAFRRVFRVEAGARAGDERAWTRRLTAFYAGYELPQAHMRPSAGLAGLVRGLLEAEPYHAVVATYAFTAPLFAGLGRRVLTVCDVQDILHEHADACQRTTGQSSSFSLPRATEAFLWRQWDVLVAITPEDKARISAEVSPHQCLISARHALASCAVEPAPGDDDVALYAGSDNQSNVQAVGWLLEHVWPRVVAARPSARLRIAGLICNALPESASRLPGVELLGFQQNLDGELARSGVLAAPYLYGSGLKIKVVEAACAGKAIVTTSAGVLGTMLDAGRAIAVHDEAAPFADGLVALLGNRQTRIELAAAALDQARALFSPEACYEPIRFAIRLHSGHTSLAPGHGLTPAILERITVVVDHVKPTRVVLWGNGSHTRSLVGALCGIGVNAALIVDGRGTQSAVSPEGLPVVPAAEFPLVGGDLVVLSSETFEAEMWRDLSAYRDAGGHVLGLFNQRFVSRNLIDRLSPQGRLQIDAPSGSVRPDARPVLAVWDAGMTHVEWWRLCAASDLAAAAADFGARGVVVTPTAVAIGSAVHLPHDVSLAPVLECDGRTLEIRDPDGGTRALARASHQMAHAARHALEFTGLDSSDVLVVVRPSLSECFGLGRALADRGREAPSVVLYGVGLEDDDSDLPAAAGPMYWQLAIAQLDAAVKGRLAVAAADPADANNLRLRVGRAIRSIGMPVSIPRTDAARVVPHIICLGHVGVPRVRPLLEAIVEHVRPANGSAPLATIGWRSNQGDAPAWADDQWAVGLATLLDITLLDDWAPLEMRAEIAAADAVILMGDGSERWLSIVRGQAQAAGVPVLQPYDSRDLVEPLTVLLRGDVPDAADAVNASAQPAPAVLARLLEMVTGRAPVASASLLSETPASHELATEMCS